MKTRHLSAGSFFDKFVDNIENIHYFFSRKLRRPVQDYFEIETTQSENEVQYSEKDVYREENLEKESFSIVAKDGSLLTVLEFDGVRTTMDKKAIQSKLNLLDSSSLSTLLKEPGYTLEFFFSMSPEGGKDMIKNLTQKNIDTVEKFNLDFQDIMDSKVKHLPKFIHEEKCYLGIWTHPSSISKLELDQAIEEKMEKLKNMNYFRFNIKDRNGQYPSGGLDVLFNKHTALIETLSEELNKTLGFKVKKITSHATIHLIKTIIYGDEVPENWKPYIIGDKLPPSLREQKGNKKGYDLLLDPTDLVYPPLSTQILDSDIYTPKEHPNCVIVGQRMFSSVSMEIPPKPRPFNDLLQKFVDAKVPFNMRVVIKSQGMAYKGLKAMLADALNFIPPNNKRIQESIKWLNIIGEQETLLRFSMSFQTYAPITEYKLLKARTSQVKHLVASWGQGQLRDSFGDPADAFFDGIPFISPNMGQETNYHLAPMYDVMKMMPIFRPASVFDNGACLYRSEDGKLIPFEICSPLQTTWAYYIMAIPGSGKSVDLAIKLLGSITQAGIKRLPYISTLDIGPSQSYFIRMIQSAYPQEYKRLAVTERLTMERRHAINMFDLQLGCEKPDEIHREMLINFMCELLTPPSAEKIDDNFPSLITATIDRAYKKLSISNRDGIPKIYTENTDQIVDSAINKTGIQIVRGRTSWYQVRDELFDLASAELDKNKKQRLIEAAERAQRYAVPLIDDLIEASKDQDIVDTYAKIISTDGSGEPLLDKYIRLIGIAKNNYPSLFLPTAIDFSYARIVSLDLDLVTKGEGDTGRKQQVIMYMVAKYAITKNFRLDKEIVSTFPDRYQSYHMKRVEEMFMTNKILCVDEYHRTKNSPFIQNDFIRDAREGRKWKLSIILSSQQGDDISNELRKFLTGIFVLRANGEQNARELQERFGFGDAEREVLLNKCHGPTSKGAPFLAILQTDEGLTSQLLYSTISPVEAWALTTTVEDVTIRNKLSEVLGMREARGRLGRAYDFTIKHTLKDLQDANLKGRNDPNFDAIEQIYQSLINSSPVYTHNEGAIHDATSVVDKYYAQVDLEKQQERILAFNKKRQRDKEIYSHE